MVLFYKFTQFSPQSAPLTPLRIPISAILHFVLFGFNLDIEETL